MTSNSTDTTTGTSGTPATGRAAGPGTPGLSRFTLEIDGMTCGHCVRTVTGALASVPGVQVRSVAVGHAEIAAADGLAVAEAVNAINEAGYTAVVKDPAPAGGGSDSAGGGCCSRTGRGGGGGGCCG